MSVRDCSDEYKAWDNTEIARAELRNVWSADQQDYVRRHFENVVVCRVGDTDAFEEAEGFTIRGEELILWIAAATLDGDKITDGDLITLADGTWTVSKFIKTVRGGGSISHYTAVCYPQRG